MFVFNLKGEVMHKLLVMGAGGYTLEPSAEVIDSFFLEKIGKENPRICMLPTACGERQESIDKFYNYFMEKGAIASHISLFAPEIEDLDAYLASQDGIYITGGNTKSMLALWKEWGVDKALINAYNSGVFICGISAGAMCFFEEGLSDSFPNQYKVLGCFGILSGSFCPHYIQNEKRAMLYKDNIQNNKTKPGIAVEDGIALYYENGLLTEIIRSRAEANVYRIYSTGNIEIISA
jgi:peptidase E